MIFSTEDEWVRAVNQKCREIELMTAFVHPLAYGWLPMLPKLHEEYHAIAQAWVLEEGMEQLRLWMQEEGAA